jgi:uncharacterized damage-inducible protein DinB
MTLADAFISEFDHEAQGTRRLLERLPDDKLSFKPHPKSMSLGGLATHIADIPFWIRTVVNDSSFDLGSVESRTPECKSRQEILDYFEKNRTPFGELLEGKSDEHLLQTWTLRNQGANVLTLPRVACIRSFILSHIIHHRGQLTVYLRLNEVALPGLYGPSADEGF